LTQKSGTSWSSIKEWIVNLSPLLALMAVAIWYLYVGGNLALDTYRDWQFYRPYESQGVALQGEIVERFIRTCTSQPCKRYPETGSAQRTRPDLATSHQFDEENCIDRAADGSNRKNGSMGDGPCEHTIVARYLYAGKSYLIAERFVPRAYWESWAETHKIVLALPSAPEDAVFRDNTEKSQSRDYLLLWVSVPLLMAFHYFLKSRLWKP
jgi:hypothetical protein